MKKLLLLSLIFTAACDLNIKIDAEADESLLDMEESESDYENEEDEGEEYEDEDEQGEDDEEISK